jgi:hypothetical protein
MSKIVYKKRPNPIARKLREPRYRKQVTIDKTVYSRKKKTSIEELYDIIRGWNKEK